jgi:hypothetical protein
MKAMRNTMSELFGPEAMQEEGRKLPHRAARNKSQAERTTKISASAQKKHTKTLKKAVEKEIDELADLFKKL